MGSPKHALKLGDGRAMIEHVAEALRGACGGVSQERIILGPADIVKHVSIPGARCVADNEPDCGPLGGIEALLSSGIAEHYLVCACDTPMVTAKLLRRLRVTTAKPITLFHVEGADKCEPMPMRISASVWEEVRRRLRSDDRSVYGLVDALPREEFVLSAEDAKQLRNINTPGEYESLKR